MSLKPIMMKPQSLLQEILNKKTSTVNDGQPPADQYELVDSSLTVRENEEFFINCNVESSRPAADVKFTIGHSPDGGNNIVSESIVENHLSSVFVLTAASGAASSLSSSSTSLISPLSIVSSFTNVAKNSDQTFKTVHTTRLKANMEDHGKVIACKAENGFSNQKWENKKLLNVLCNIFICFFFSLLSAQRYKFLCILKERIEFSGTNNFFPMPYTVFF